MFRCAKCHCDKQGQQYKQAMKNGDIPLICNNCVDRFVNELVCSICNRSKKGTSYTRFMLNGDIAPVCHICKSRSGTLPSKYSNCAPVERKCLKCEKEFVAPNKFTRLCGTCKSRNDNYISDIEGL